MKRYRVGRIRRREFPGSHEALYTVEELSWFWSERTGMYTAVNGTVYDLTGEHSPSSVGVVRLDLLMVLCRLLQVASWRADCPP